MAGHYAPMCKSSPETVRQRKPAQNGECGDLSLGFGEHLDLETRAISEHPEEAKRDVRERLRNLPSVYFVILVVKQTYQR